MINMPASHRVSFPRLRSRVQNDSQDAMHRFHIPDPVRISVALLTDCEISRMEVEDLVSVIECADIPPVDKRVFRSLDFHRVQDLRRLVHAVRTACRDYCDRLLTKPAAHSARIDEH